MSAPERLPAAAAVASPLTAHRGGQTATPLPRMDIHTLQRHFWKLDAEQHFSGNETRLYFYWLNRFNAEFWPSELAHTCRQVEADLGFDDKTHSKVRAVLMARGLLFYQEGDKRTKARWSLVGKLPANAQNGRKNSDESEAITPQMPRIFSDENSRITPQMPRKNSDPYIEQTKTCSREETQTQKKEGAGELEISPSPSQKITAPNPVAQPPSPALGSVAPSLVAGTDESRALAEEMATYWAIPHGNARRRGQFATFTRTLNAGGRLAEVRTQFEAYRRYQQLRGISRYAIDKYLGHELEGYTDGEWCGSEWAQVLAEASQQQASKKPFGPEEKPARSSAAPSTQKTSWR